MATIFTFILAALAVYRVARMLALETGPSELFINFRSFILEQFGKDHWVTEGVGCPLCISFWLSIFPGIIIGGNLWLLWWLGLAGAATWLYKQERE